MSEPNRDDTTGQFAPADNTFGIEHEQQKAGFTTRKSETAVDEPKVYSSDIDGIREAAAELTASRDSSVLELSVSELRGERDLTEAVTLEQAAAEYAAARANVSRFADGLDFVS